MFKGFTFLHAEAFHHRSHAVCCGEVAHEVVFEGNEELGTTRVTLARTTAAKLAVDPARLVALSADDKKPADFGNSRGEFDVCAAACHVGGNGDGAKMPGAGNDVRFLGVEFGVEDGVRDFRTLE